MATKFNQRHPHRILTLSKGYSYVELRYMGWTQEECSYLMKMRRKNAANKKRQRQSKRRAK